MNLKKLKTKWVPSKSDVAWLDRLFSVMWVGHYWAFDHGLCQVDNEAKILTVKEITKDGKETVARAIKIAKMLGYTVK